MSVLTVRGAHSEGLPDVVITEDEEEEERVEQEDSFVEEAEEKAPTKCRQRKARE